MFLQTRVTQHCGAARADVMHSCRNGMNAAISFIIQLLLYQQHLGHPELLLLWHSRSSETLHSQQQCRRRSVSLHFAFYPWTGIQDSQYPKVWELSCRYQISSYADGESHAWIFTYFLSQRFRTGRAAHRHQQKLPRLPYVWICEHLQSLPSVAAL